jgi:hypothetical protein
LLEQVSNGGQKLEINFLRIGTIYLIYGIIMNKMEIGD